MLNKHALKPATSKGSPGYNTSLLIRAVPAVHTKGARGRHLLLMFLLRESFCGQVRIEGMVGQGNTPTLGNTIAELYGYCSVL